MRLIVNSLTLCLAAVAAESALPYPCFALENRVTVESRTFYPGQEACTVGVFFENSVGLTGIVAPLEIRSIDSGVYPVSGFWRQLNHNGRIWGGPLYSCTSAWCAPQFPPLRTFATPAVPNSCSGPLSHSWNASASNIDYVSPDAIMLAVVSTGDPNIGDDVTLDPGSDGTLTKNASLLLGFNAGAASGQFEIDTCCTLPMNHLSYVDSNTSVVHPQFTKGVITIACVCPCANDPYCDSVITDGLDVTETINVAFRAKSAQSDNGCPQTRTDVDCNGVTDIVDVVRVVFVSFYGYDRALYYCNPCE